MSGRRRGLGIELLLAGVFAAGCIVDYGYRVKGQVADGNQLPIADARLRMLAATSCAPVAEEAGTRTGAASATGRVSTGLMGYYAADQQGDFDAVFIGPADLQRFVLEISKRGYGTRCLVLDRADAKSCDADHPGIPCWRVATRLEAAR